MTHRILLLSAFALAACGDKTKPADGQYDFAGLQVDGGLSGPDGFIRDFAGEDMPEGDLSGGDLSGGDLTTSPDAPTITIVSPMATDVLASNSLKVRVTVTSPVNAGINSVQLNVPQQAMPVTLATVAANTFEGTVNVSGAPSMASFQVTATDAAGRTRTVDGAYKHDVGPTIAILSPSATTLQGQTQLKFNVADPLGFTIATADVKASIGTNVIMLDSSAAPQYTATIVFASFSPALDGQQRITITAKNSNGTTATATRDFVVDNKGPTITVNTPLPNEFAAAFVTINATIDDESGVDESTVVAVFANDPTKYKTKLLRTAPTQKTFQGTFDVRALGTNFVLPSLSVRADDIVGNHSDVTYQVAVDNTPPVLSLVPPPVRVATKVGSQWQCSALFDPVGDQSVDDGDVVQQVFTARARIEDQGNDPPGNLLVRISTVDPATVRLVILPTPTNTGVLAVDTDGDGECDNVDPNLQQLNAVTMSGANQALGLTMNPIADTGTANYHTTGAPFPGCDTVGDPNVTDDPAPLCLNSGTTLTYAMHYSAGNLPSIWAPELVASNSTQCVGSQVDSLNSLPEGPACLVVVATDKTKNTSVSAPIRICINRGGGKCGGFVPTADCTGTHDPVTKTTTATPCTPRASFPAGEIHKLL